MISECDSDSDTHLRRATRAVICRIDEVPSLDAEFFEACMFKEVFPAIRAETGTAA